MKKKPKDQQPFPPEMGEVECAYVINATAGAFDKYVNDMPPGSFKDALLSAPRRNFGKKFPTELHKDTIAFIAFTDKKGCEITKDGWDDERKSKIKERDSTEKRTINPKRRVFMAPFNPKNN